MPTPQNQLPTVSVPMTLPPVSPDDNGVVVGAGVGDRGDEGSDVCIVSGNMLGIREGASVVGGTVTLTSSVGDVMEVVTLKRTHKKRWKNSRAC